MANRFEIELGFEIGQEFIYNNDYIKITGDNNYFKITSIIIRICNNEISVKYGAYVNWGKKSNRKIWWNPSTKYFTEKELSTVLERKPHTYSRDLKFSIGDIVINGVNGQIPDDITTYKGSNIFVGDVFEVTEISITIEETREYVKVGSNNILYDGFERKIRKNYPHNYFRQAGEQYCGLISTFDVDSLIDIICKEMTKKKWINDIYYGLYDTKNFEPLIDNYGAYCNTFAGLFKYLGVEEKAKETFKKYLDERINGSAKIKKTNKGEIDKEKLNNIIYSLSDEEREALLKELTK